MFEKMNGETPDLTKDNIDKLKQLFPEIVTDGRIDFEKLQAILGKEIDDAPDRYNFTWHGKKETLQFAQQSSKGTLRPIKEKSKNWDTTGNLYIEGDNLEVLKLLQKSYSNKIKLIYIDPPYNTGNDFVYKDNFKNSIDSYLELTGQKDQEGNKFTTNTETSGRYHTDWLNMMYPRLKLARNLLTDDGVIFISIDDNEIDNLRKLCDEVFGPTNRIANLVWDLKSGPQAGHFTRAHEYILVYAKSKNNLPNFALESDEKIVHGALKKISSANPESIVEFPVGFEYEGTNAVFEGILGKSEKQHIIDGKMIFENGKLKYPTKISAGWGMKNQLLSWLEGKETFDSKGQKVVRFYFNKNGILFYEKERSVVNPKTVINDIGGTKTGSNELINLFSEKLFDFPKPVELIKRLASYIMYDKNSYALDFFSGSAPTAHAVMRLNAEDGGNRKFIMVQLPEVTDEKSEAYKAGYKNICDIGEERIRRAGEKVKNDLVEKNNKEGLLSNNKVNPDDLDVGFKVFKLDSSNLTEWQANFDELELNIDLFESNFLNDRSELDILFEIMLKNGLDLTYPVTEISEGDHKIYDVASGNLFVCLNDNINRDVARKIAELRKEYGIETSQVVFKDSGFEDDTEKLNCYEILKEAGYQDSDLLSI